MPIYTSYFANYRNFPQGAQVIGVTRKPPAGIINWYQLAPSQQLLNEYKYGNLSEQEYSQRYLNELAQLNQEEIVNRLLELEKQFTNIVLCCYEKRGKFCHRNILAQWLNINIKEL